MKNKHFVTATFVSLALAIGLVGCGRSREEIENERKRLEMEEQAQRDLKRANQAIGEIGKKIGRKPPGLDLGLPPEKKDEPAPTQEPAKKP